MKKILCVTLCAAMLMNLAGCAVNTADQTTAAQTEAAEAADTQAAAEEGTAEGETVDTIKIGVILPLSGTSAYQGNLNREGYEYAIEYYNSKGGIKSMGGAKLEAVYADHTGVPEVGTTEVERLINVENVDILTGGNSSTVLLAVQPIVERYQIPFMINQGSSLSILSQGYTYMFNPSNDARTNVEGLIGVCEMVEEKYGDVIDGIGLIMENTEWGQSQKDVFQQYFEAAGKEVVLNEVVELGATDFSSQILKIKNSGVKFVVPCLSSFNDAVLFVRQMKEYDCNAGILASGGVFVVPEFAEALGDDINYIFSTDTWNPGFLQAKGEEALEIHQGYVDKYGHVMGENAGMSWIAISVLVAALEEAGTVDGPTLRDTIYNMDLSEDSEYMLMVPFHGMKFNEVDPSGCTNHNIYGLSCISQYIDGAWQCVWPDDILGGNNPLVWPIPTSE